MRHAQKSTRRREKDKDREAMRAVMRRRKKLKRQAMVYWEKHDTMCFTTTGRAKRPEFRWIGGMLYNMGTKPPTVVNSTGQVPKPNKSAIGLKADRNDEYQPDPPPTTLFNRMFGF